MKQILYLVFLLIGIISPLVKASPVYACANFDVPDIVASNETFQITVNGVQPGYTYALYFIDSTSPTQVQGVSQTASSTTLTFSIEAANLQANRTYNFQVQGQQGGKEDTCIANDSLFVDPQDTEGNPVPIEPGWTLNVNQECIETEDRPEFNSLEDCEAERDRVASQKEAEPTPLPPLPPCAQELSEDGLCTAVFSPFGTLGTEPTTLVNTLFTVLLSISGGIALILIIFSGYQILTSQGDPEKLKGARERLTSAIIGLLFLIFSIVILEIIGVDILRIPGLSR